MIDLERDLPHEDSADPDGVQMALRAARTLWSHGDTAESLRWLRRAAESASDEGADMRSLQLAKAAAELRAKLFPRSAVEDATEASGSPEPGDEGGVDFAPSTRRGQAEEGGATLPSPPPDATMRATWEESALAAGIPAPPPVVTATQYLEHRPREVPRSLLSLAPPARGGVAAGGRVTSSAPPPLPSLTLDDYEELEAEPDEDEDEESSLRLADPSSTFREASLHEAVTEWPPADSGAVEHVSTLPPAPMALASNPPPLPASALEDDDMRPEQPTVLIPPADDDPAAHEAALAALPTDVPGWAAAESAGSDPRASQHYALVDQYSSDQYFAAQYPAAQYPAAQYPSEQYPSEQYSPDPYPPSESSEPTFRGEHDDSGVAPAASTKLKARVHHQAVRVSFAPDARASGHFLVRPLREGEAPAPGERVALLVALEPGSPLV